MNEAMRADDWEVVCEMIRGGININDREAEWGATPLFQAVVLDKLDIAEQLLQAGANIDEPLGMEQFLDSIVEGARQGRPDAVAWIQKHEGIETVEQFLASPNYDLHKKTGAMTALWSATSKGQTKIVDLLLRYGASTESRATGGLTPLHVAANNGSTEIAALLIDAGANINALDDVGRTPLTAAAYEAQIDTMKLLLKAGADPNAYGPPVGEPPVNAAASGGSTEALDVLAEVGVEFDVPRSSGVRPIHDAAMNGHVSAIKYLLERGAQVDARTDSGATPLWLAAGLGQLEAVKALVEAGADTSIRAENGTTALDRATQRSHQAVIDFLQNYKSN